ncbi:hypothetical protein AVEN_149676-1 [Araneus ventricosus]|uniref:Mos1 transposase HTH domain-containing protein n=1 Tax=Araneus ventricosus TaxID=182803 RepID=A0A4Y2LRE0_ARAVE|nr:hypothetical protein AVEN_149676-1 [Araneus ventricosus]
MCLYRILRPLWCWAASQCDVCLLDFEALYVGLTVRCVSIDFEALFYVASQCDVCLLDFEVSVVAWLVRCVFKILRPLDGKEDVKDQPRSGRPPTSTTPDNIERVRRMLADDRRLSLRMIAEELKISLDSASNIIHEHLQKRKKKVRHYSDPATCDNGASSDTERSVCCQFPAAVQPMSKVYCS